MDRTELPDGWEVWSEEADGRAVLTFRPDVFDSERFPPACLPTLYVAPGQPNRPAGERRTAGNGTWRIELFLEPEVEVPGTRQFESREAALEAAVDLAARFANGEVDYRSAYRVPREAYLDRLDELTGRDA